MGLRSGTLFPEVYCQLKQGGSGPEPESLEGLKSKTNNSGNPINREMEAGCYVATVTSTGPQLFPDALQMPISPVAQSRGPGGHAVSRVRIPWTFAATLFNALTFAPSTRLLLLHVMQISIIVTASRQGPSIYHAGCRDHLERLIFINVIKHLLTTCKAGSLPPTVRQ